MANQLNYYLDQIVDYKNEKLEIQLREATTVLSKWVFDTREEAIRDGLIKLGWTPPPKDEKF